MSKSLNKLCLIGNVGSVEVRSNGIAKVSLATNRKYRNKGGGDVEETQWHRLTFFGVMAENVLKWVKKGDRLYIEGRVEYSETESDGVKRYWTDVVVNEMVMLGGNQQNGAPVPIVNTTPPSASQADPIPVTVEDGLPF